MMLLLVQGPHCQPKKKKKKKHSLSGGLVAQSCLTFETSWTVAFQAPLSMEFFKQEHWSGLPFPSPRIEPRD